MKSGLSELQDRLLAVAYAVELCDLKSNRLDEYAFYANLEITKSFMHDDEFSSPFSTYIVEQLHASVLYLLGLRIFRTENLFRLHEKFLLEAISSSFKTAFTNILKEHSRQVAS